MSILYFIGASGVGKSTISGELSRNNAGIQYEELDGIYREYKVKRKDHLMAVKKTKERLEEIENLKDSKTYLIDVGSFAQKYVNIDFWKARGECLICVKNDINFCYDNYKKRKKKRMTFEGWKKSEFSSKRKELYLLAKYEIDGTNSTLSATKENVLKIVNSLRLAH